MPKVTIDGQTIEVPQGTSVIKAAQLLGIPIAHYCWHEGLSVAGACRMCMVEIEKVPKLQIACNQTVSDGMVVHTKTEKVKESVRWALDFHLINHPLDCPICDQAGECKLQDYYMSYGLYNPEMNQRKVKKSKVVSLGDRVVLDQERCILCSRCVRFTKEVTKTDELGIFNRGDRSILATFEGRPLNNNYSVNTVDICPVGALTSKDFRFKQRVWFLKDVDSVCTGCSTGCNITVSYNANGVFRVRPKVNKDVNGFWMCDEGRDVYKHVNKEYRLTQVVEKREDLGGRQVKGKPVAQALQEIAKDISDVAKRNASNIAVVVTAQYTVEEYSSLFEFFAQKLKVENFFYWKGNEKDFDSFDGLLMRGDKNPNTAGLLQVAKKAGVTLKNFDDYSKKGGASAWGITLVMAPENQKHYDMKSASERFKNGGKVIWYSACPIESSEQLHWQIPARSFLEKDGTYINAKGLEQKVKKAFSIVPDAISVDQFVMGIREPMAGGLS